MSAATRTDRLTLGRPIPSGGMGPWGAAGTKRRQEDVSKYAMQVGTDPFVEKGAEREGEGCSTSEERLDQPSRRVDPASPTSHLARNRSERAETCLLC